MNGHRTRTPRGVAVLLALVMVLTACGDDDSGGGSANRPPDTDDTTRGTDAEAGGEPEPVPGFDGTTIRLGVITPQTGPAAIVGTPVTNGNRAYWDYVNEELGGVGGRYPVELVVVDSKNDPTTSVQQYNAIKGGVVMFEQVLGTPIVAALQEQLATDNVVAQPGSLDAFWVRDQHLFPFGAPYQIQAINALSWYVSEGGGEDATICFAGHDDPYGDAGLEGARFAAAEVGFELAVEARFRTTDTEFSAAVQQLRGADCEAVFLTATPPTAAGLMGTAAQQGFSPQWIGQSPTYLPALFLSGGLAPYLEEHFLLVAEGAQWGDASVPGMAQLIAHHERYAPDQEPDPAFVAGYTEAWAVHQLLEAAVANGDLSRDGIIDAMNGLDVLEFDGLSGTYAYGTVDERDPPRVSTIYRIDGSVPAGLATVAASVESEPAQRFTFDDE